MSIYYIMWIVLIYQSYINNCYIDIFDKLILMFHTRKSQIIDVFRGSLLFNMRGIKHSMFNVFL